MFKYTAKVCLIALFLLRLAPAKSNDSTARQRGFVSYQASYDTLWQFITQKKQPSIDSFILSDSMFHEEFRKNDSTQIKVMVDAFSKTYRYGLHKSFAKSFKKMHGHLWNYRRVEIYEILRYPMSQSGDKVKVEIYFKHNKNKGVFTYYLWKLNARWYFIEKFKIRKD